MFWVSYSRPGGQKHEGEFPVPSWVCATLSHHLFTMSWCRVSHMQGTEATPESPSGLGKNLKGLQKATEIAKVLGINGRGKPHYFIISKTHSFWYGMWKKRLVQYTVQYIAYITGLPSYVVPRHFLDADASIFIRLPKEKGYKLGNGETGIAWQLRTECRSLNLD